MVAFGAPATTERITETEDELLGQSYSSALLKQAARHVRDVMDPESDVHVTEEYRRNAAEVLTVRALEDAFARAQTAKS